LIVLAACSPKVYVEAMKPATYDVADIKRVAVLDFEGPGSSGKVISSLFTDKLWKTQYFTLIERQEIEQVLNEHAFNMTGVVDDSTIVEFGRILGVDAIIVGHVNAYNSKDTRGREKVKEKVFTGKYEKDDEGNFVYEKNIFGKKHKKKIYEEVMVDQVFLLREATVSVSYRMVEIENASIRASDQAKQSFRRKYTKDLNKIPPEQDILSTLSEQVVNRFIPGLTPHRVQLRKTLEKGNDAVDLGIQYAKNGLWTEAITTWEEETRQNPGNAQAYYNLGVAYEVKGDMTNAENAYRAAMNIKPKKLYMRAVAEIDKRKSEQKKLKKQLRFHNRMQSEE
jgi:hypothetical protein